MLREGQWESEGGRCNVCVVPLCIVVAGTYHRRLCYYATCMLPGIYSIFSSYFKRLMNLSGYNYFACFTILENSYRELDAKWILRHIYKRRFRFCYNTMCLDNTLLKWPKQFFLFVHQHYYKKQKQTSMLILNSLKKFQKHFSNESYWQTINKLCV